MTTSKIRIWFKPQRASLEHLQECKGRLPKYVIGVEFRNRRWLEGSNLRKTLDFLNHNDLVYVAVDGPQGLTSSLPTVVDTGMKTSVIRFHERNRAGWESNVKAERCNHWYSENEMAAWVEKIRSIQPHVDEVHLVMNTNQGVENARLMGRLLGEGLKQKTSLL